MRGGTGGHKIPRDGGGGGTGEGERPRYGWGAKRVKAGAARGKREATETMEASERDIGKGR